VTLSFLKMHKLFGIGQEFLKYYQSQKLTQICKYHVNHYIMLSAN